MHDMKLNFSLKHKSELLPFRALYGRPRTFAPAITMTVLAVLITVCQSVRDPDPEEGKVFLSKFFGATGGLCAEKKMLIHFGSR